MSEKQYKYKCGLVVEGGGTKIAYSAGVLQTFLEEKIYFPYSVGISSGSEVLLAYVSRQIDRLKVTTIEAADQKGAIGIVPLLRKADSSVWKPPINILKNMHRSISSPFSNPLRTWKSACMTWMKTKWNTLESPMSIRA
ncbi:patatin-like phospholipase family protein [Allobaculum sp. Allo2]|uniref:patatin-like phospholipase family protein n=1 Tax=Allobaculum sp. Allo2 TaxID=2853432 RepID=UPI001F612376|nr:patatin-like phospholipase family protein [Allobaculum sp. Allo2]